MIESLTDKIASFFIVNMVMDEKKYKLYKANIKALIYLVVSVVSVISVGLFFNKVIQGIILLLCYVLIRKCAYGYKNKNYIIRLALFLGIFILTIYISDYEDITTYKSLVGTFTILSVVGVFILSPVNDIKNPIELKKVSKYKNISRVISLIIAIFTLGILEIHNLNEYAAFTSSALFWSAIMLVLGTIKNYIRY